MKINVGSAQQCIPGPSLKNSTSVGDCCGVPLNVVLSLSRQISQPCHRLSPEPDPAVARRLFQYRSIAQTVAGLLARGGGPFEQAHAVLG